MMEGSAAFIHLADEISAMRTDLQALTQGLLLMVETQETQSEMLQQLLQAATQETPDENPMEALFKKLTVALDGLTGAQKDTRRAIERMTQRMAGAIIRGAGQPAEDDPEETDEEDEPGED